MLTFERIMCIIIYIYTLILYRLSGNKFSFFPGEADKLVEKVIFGELPWYGLIILITGNLFDDNI